MMRWGEMTSLVFSFAITVAGILIAVQQARAADLDEPYQPRPRRPAATGPAVIAGVPNGPTGPNCKLIPQPEVNLYGDTTRFRPTLICMSRGIYADFYKPFPVYNPYYSEWFGNFNPIH